MSECEEIYNFVIAISTTINTIELGFEAYEASEAFEESRRRWWVRPVNLTREEEGFFKSCTTQIKEKDEEHFFKATRMTVANFNLLLTLLKERLQRFSNRKAISPEARLTITLLYLAQGCNMQVLAWAHKLGVSTVRKIIYETCEAIWVELHCSYLSPPSEHECKGLADKFFVKTGMPNCVGAIDGKHINIVRPRNSGSLFYNYKKIFSIVLLASCDADYVFTYADVGALGTLEVPAEANLPGSTIPFPYYFVGDSAFPLKSNLMRPYPGHNLPQDKDNFNVTMSRARVHIENAFGILANRWRLLLTNINAFPENADKLVLATVVLHNFLMLTNDRNYLRNDLVDYSENNADIQGSWKNDTTLLISHRPRYANRSTSNAFGLRDCLKDYLHNNSRH